jgi:iron(III) transport system ATP-binding protein
MMTAFPSPGSPVSALSAVSDRRSEQLQLIGLTKAFGTGSGVVRAVDGVTLTIEPGTFLTLLGPSGCGKTTMLRMIAGFEDPTDGRIVLGDRDLHKLPANKRPMAMVFQNYALFPHLSVFDNVAYGLKVLKKSSAEIKESVTVALTSMNLTGMADRDPHQLSGGQQQRVALARAMVMKPDVLLFDEPLSNLDAKLRVQMRNEIRELQRRMGITSIYVTHDQEEAMSLSDQIVVMNKGKVEQVGSPSELYLTPSSVFVADFLGTANFLEVRVQSISEGIAKVEVLGTTAAVRVHPEVNEKASCVLMVRPEAMEISSATETTANARVLSCAYLGSVAEVRLDSSYGELFASIGNPDPQGLPKAGDSVHVSFDGNKTYLLPDRL